MSYNPQRLKKAFYVFSSIFKKQLGFGTAIADGDLDSRHNCTITFEDVKERETIYDCSGEDIFDETVESQLKRIRISYTSITAQRIFGWICLLLSSVLNPTGSPANEVQTITSDADGGAAPFTFAFEGVTGTTPNLAYNITAANFKAALEALDSIGEGQITSVTGANLAAGFVVTFGGKLAHASLPAITVGSGLTKTAGSPTTTVVRTTHGNNNYHAASRSTDDQLAKTSIGCGYEGNSEDPEKFRDLVVESITITFNRRKNVTVDVVCIGRFTPSDMVGFTEPDCENLPALKTLDCKLKVNGNYLIEEFWSGTITLNNVPPTGDSAFPFSGIEVVNLERGDKPTYPITLQILGSEGDTVGELCRLEQKVDVEFLMGVPGERAYLIFPNTLFKFNSTPKTYVGEVNKSAHSIDANPHKDASLSAPLRAEYYGDQSEAFLQT